MGKDKTLAIRSKVDDVEKKISIFALNVANDLRKVQDVGQAAWQLVNALAELMKSKGIATEEEINASLSSVRDQWRKERLDKMAASAEEGHLLCTNCNYQGPKESFVDATSATVACPNCKKQDVVEGTKKKEVTP